ncbi:hypothetical protein PIB30_061859, partial [Stylosanthes scabra]|nr:hypothetical protein [Stylosanthes scabra]
EQRCSYRQWISVTMALFPAAKGATATTLQGLSFSFALPFAFHSHVEPDGSSGEYGNDRKSSDDTLSLFSNMAMATRPSVSRFSGNRDRGISFSPLCPSSFTLPASLLDDDSV